MFMVPLMVRDGTSSYSSAKPPKISGKTWEVVVRTKSPCQELVPVALLSCVSAGCRRGSMVGDGPPLWGEQGWLGEKALMAGGKDLGISEFDQLCTQSQQEAQGRGSPAYTSGTRQGQYSYPQRSLEDLPRIPRC